MILASIGVGNPRDDVFTERDLRIHGTGPRHRIAGLEIHKVPGELGRPEVEGNAKRCIVAAEDPHHMLVPRLPVKGEACLPSTAVIERGNLLFDLGGDFREFRWISPEDSLK